MTTLYLFDIEGTTTDIDFVHKVLFPYSAKCMEEFVLSHPELPAIDVVKQTVLEEENRSIDQKGVVEKLLTWIREDRKHPALKEIQGLIWDKGYAQGHFRGHVYPDVLPFFRAIKEAGKDIGIYSSGSVHAQKLIFGFSEVGDLTPFISCYFDTRVGPKREQLSYEKIARETKLEPSQIRFFSDVPEELKAAVAAGLKVTHVVRPGTAESAFDGVKSFEELRTKL